MAIFNTKIKTSLLILGVLTSVIPFSQAHSVTLVNGGFEDGFNSWGQIGDTSIQSGGPSLNSGNDFNQIAPYAGMNHALITTACTSNTERPSGFCTIDGANAREGIDDASTPAGTYNFSGNPVANATSNSGLGDGFALQGFLGLSNNSLFAIEPDREVKEGSAIRQIITVTQEQVDANARFRFAWAFLTNDTRDVGDTFGLDFSFLSVTRFNNTTDALSNTNRQDEDVNVLAQSIQNPFSFDPLNPSSVNFTAQTAYTINNTYNFTLAGTYIIGFGVVDGGGSEKSSALLIDNVQYSDEIPEGSNLLGILGLGLGLLFIPKSKIKK